MNISKPKFKNWEYKRNRLKQDQTLSGKVLNHVVPSPSNLAATLSDNIVYISSYLFFKFYLNKD